MPRKTLKENNKNGITSIIKNPALAKQLGLLKGVAEIGIKTAGKGAVIVYKRTSWIGEIAKDVLFLLVGISIFLAGLLATPADMFSIVKLVATLEHGLVGRTIIIIFGLSLVSYGLGKFVKLFKEKFFEEKK